MITETKYNDPVKKMLIEAKSSVDEGNVNRAVWCCLDAAWYMLKGNKDARERVKEASDFIYPANPEGRGAVFARRNGGYGGY